MHTKYTVHEMKQFFHHNIKSGPLISALAFHSQNVIDAILVLLYN